MTVSISLRDEGGLELRDEHDRVIGRVFHPIGVAPVGPGQGAVYLVRSGPGANAGSAGLAGCPSLRRSHA
jgi:hypothetical protein